MSRTVADRRFQRRAMTSVSRGPRNFSSAFSGLRRRRRSGRLTPRLSRAPATHGDALSPPEEARMPFGEPLSAVRERDVELDDEMPVARLVQGPPGTLAPLDDTGQGQGGELPLRIALLQAGPRGGTLRGVLAEGKGVEEAEPPRIGDPLERRRSALVLLVTRALEQGGVAGEEVQVPVFDGHSQPPKPGLRQLCRSSALHTTPVSYVLERPSAGLTGRLAGGTGQRVAREPLTGRVRSDWFQVVGSGPVGERATPTRFAVRAPAPGTGPASSLTQRRQESRRGAPPPEGGRRRRWHSGRRRAPHEPRPRDCEL